MRSGSCDRFAARPSASANLTPLAQANLAQTTVGDLGFAVRSVGISLGPGRVDFVDGPSLSADPPDLAAKQLMIGYLKNNEATGRERKDKGLRRTRATSPGAA